VGPDGAKPPQGDTALRERLAKAAAEWAYAYPISSNALGRTDDGAWKLARIWGEQIARIAVMPVVEAWAAEQAQQVRERTLREAADLIDSKPLHCEEHSSVTCTRCPVGSDWLRIEADRIAGPEGT
jgi:hypothetical protein